MPALHLTHLTLDLVHLLLHGLSLPSHDCGGTRTHGRLRIPEPATGTGVQYRNLTQHSGPQTRTFSPCLLVSSEGPSFWFPTFCNTPPNQQSHPKAAHAVRHWECMRTSRTLAAAPGLPPHHIATQSHHPQSLRGGRATWSLCITCDTRAHRHTWSRLYGSTPHCH